MVICSNKMAMSPKIAELIVQLAREMLNAERAAVQNAEHGNGIAVEKHQQLADAKMREIELAVLHGK